MPKRKRIALSPFVLRRAKRLRLNPDVPIAITRICGREFGRTWLKMKCAVFDYARSKRGKGRTWASC